MRLSLPAIGQQSCAAEFIQRLAERILPIGIHITGAGRQCALLQCHCQRERFFQLRNRGGHIQLLPLGPRLRLRGDHHPLCRTQSHPVIGTGLQPFPAFFSFRIDKVAQIELPLAVLRRNLDMLLTPAVLQTDFVQRCRADNIAGIITVCDQIGVSAVMHHMRNERPVRVATFKGNGNFRPIQQRKMKTVSVAGVRPAQPD